MPKPKEQDSGGEGDTQESGGQIPKIRFAEVFRNSCKEPIKQAESVRQLAEEQLGQIRDKKARFLVGKLASGYASLLDLTKAACIAAEKEIAEKDYERILTSGEDMGKIVFDVDRLLNLSEDDISKSA